MRISISARIRFPAGAVRWMRVAVQRVLLAKQNAEMIRLVIWTDHRFR